MNIRFDLEKIKLPLQYSWAISRGSTDFKENFFVHVYSGNVKGRGEIAPNKRYGETPELIEKQFDIFARAYNEDELSIEAFSQFLEKSELCQSLKFGLESAYTHCLLNKEGQSVHSYFNLEKPGALKTSFSIPILKLEKVRDLIEQKKQFHVLKIKVDHQSAYELVDFVSRYTSLPLRIDANEAFDDYDQLMNFLSKLKEKNIEFIEQPFPSHMENEYKTLKKESPYMIFADESIINNANFQKLSQQFHGVNVKLMKAGGYQKAVELLKKARENGLKTMLGCMIETSLGIFSAMELSSLADYYDLDGHLHLKQDPIGCIAEDRGFLTQIRENFN